VFPVLGEQDCSGGDSCCNSKPGGCLVEEGDCDYDDHCAGDLVCGEDNCVGVGFDGTDDCCYQPTGDCLPGMTGGICPTPVVEEVVQFAVDLLSSCGQSKFVVTNFKSQSLPTLPYFFDLELPEAPGCDLEAASKVCDVVVNSLSMDSGTEALSIEYTNCTAPPPVPTPVPTPDFNVTVSCNELKNMHHAIARARIAYHCSDEPATGDQTECDRQLLLDLSSCSLEDSQYCFFQLIANETVCFPDNEKDEICNAMHRITNFLLYARQAFCNIPDPKSGCGFWTKLGCTAAILAADAACAAVNLADGEALLVPCVTGVMGVGSSCIPCICDILGIGGC